MAVTLTCALIFVGFTLTSVLGVRLARRWMRRELLATAKKHASDSFMVATAGLYGVLVAFLLGGALARFQHAQENAVAEVNSAAVLATLSAGFPAPIGGEIRADAE